MTVEQAVEAVTKEKYALVTSAQKILELIENNDERLSIEKEILNVANHLSIIGGYCSNDSRKTIEICNMILRNAVGSKNPVVFRHYKENRLKPLMVEIVSVEVDFKKKPFKIIGLKIDFIRGLLEGRFER